MRILRSLSVVLVLALATTIAFATQTSDESSHNTADAVPRGLLVYDAGTG